MRRPAPEWLLLPVFLLPLAVAAAFVIVARSTYLDTVASYRKDGATHARRWLDADPRAVRSIQLTFDVRLRALIWGPFDESRRPDSRGWATFRRGEISGHVWRPGATSTDPPWQIATDHPGGLTPGALADPSVRIAVEGGMPIASLPGADAATAAFGSLAAPETTANSPTAPTSLDRLRAAPLTAGAKLHLLRRRGAADPNEIAAWTALRDFGDALVAAGGQLRRGAHVQGATAILVPWSGTPCLVLPTAIWGTWAEAPKVCEDPAGIAWLTWADSPAKHAGEVLWTGRMETPVAGTWAIELPPDAAWWRSGGIARWTLPIGALCLAFLAIPTALLIGLRRRRRLDEARVRFITEIAHDLRTPITALRLHADLLTSGRAPEAARVKHVEVLGREAARVSSLLANLLDLSRLERGTRPFDRSAVDVPEVVGEAVREFELLYPRRGADVAVEVPAGLTIVGDRTALARALANLLDNAGKFTPEGTAIRVGARETTGGGARIVVADEGPGIEPEDRLRIFRTYERGSTAAAKAAPGTGLGLALVRDLVEGMGGYVTLLGTPKGAAFELTLPGGVR